MTRNDSAVSGASVVLTSAPDAGTATVDGTRIRYQSPDDFKGQVTFRYGLEVGGRLADGALVTVTVLPRANAPASAIADRAVTSINVPVTIPVLYNDVSEGFSLSVTAQANNGVAVVQFPEGCEFGCSASISYTPNPGFAGDDSFQYGLSTLASEGEASTLADTATVRVSVTAGAESARAQAVDDTVLVSRKGSVTFDPLANDVVPAGWTLALPSTTTDHGQVSWNPQTSQLTYTPDASTNAGTDRFDYQLEPPVGPKSVPGLLPGSPAGESTLISLLRDTPTGSATTAPSVISATVTVLINGPIAVDDVAVTDPSQPVSVPVAANDSGLGEYCLEVASGPQHGTAEPDPGTGTISYTPEPGFAGVDEFGYEYRDRCGDATSTAAGASVTVTVRNPVANDDNARTYPGRPIFIDVLANDRNGRLFTVRPGPAKHGEVSLPNQFEGGPARPLVYTPDPDFTGGLDTFDYELISSDGAVVGRANVAVRVQPVVAVADTEYTTAGQPVTVDVSANDTRPEGAQIRVVSDPAFGTATKDPTADTITYTPNADFADHDTDTFEYAIFGPIFEGPGVQPAFDGGGGEHLEELARATVTIRRVHAVDDSATALYGLPVDLDVLANDFGSDGLDVVPSTPAPGTIELQPVSRGVFHLTPRPDFVGTAVFEYALRHGERTVDTATVSVTVPERPDAGPDAATTTPGTPVTVNVLANDVASVGLRPQIATQGDLGTALVDVDNQVTYIPTPGRTGTDVFRYELVVPGSTVPLTAADVTITILPPDAVDDTARMFANQFEQIKVTANDRFAADFTVKVHQPKHGRTALEADGVVRYTPTHGFGGIDHFDYDLVDARGASAATGTVVVTVRLVDAVNDRVRIPHSAPPVTIRVLANDTSVSGVTVALRQLPSTDVGRVTLNSNGSVTFTPGSKFRSGDGFGYALTGLVRGVRTDLDQADVVIRLRPRPSNPGGTNPGGSNPGGSNPGGSNPGGSNPGGSTPSTPTPSPTPSISPSPTPPSTPPPDPLGVKINVGSAAPQAEVQVTGSRCPAGASVEVAVDGSSVASVNADPAGRFAATITAPSQLGRHHVSVTCGAATWTSSLDVVLTTMESATQAPAAAAVAAAALLLFFLLSGFGLNPTGRRPRPGRH